MDRRFHEMIQRCADAIFGVNANGQVCAWNAAAEDLFGYKPVEVMNRPCDEIFQGRAGFRTICSRDCDVLQCAFDPDRKIPRFEVEFKRRSGGRVWVDVSILVYTDQRTGETIVLHLCRDATRAKQREETAKQVVKLAGELAGNAVVRSEPASPLSEQERRLLRLLAAGREPAEIASELCISPRTLRNHISNANRKLGARNRLELVLQAMRSGLI